MKAAPKREVRRHRRDVSAHRRESEGIARPAVETKGDGYSHWTKGRTHDALGKKVPCEFPSSSMCFEAERTERRFGLFHISPGRSLLKFFCAASTKLVGAHVHTYIHRHDLQTKQSNMMPETMKRRTSGTNIAPSPPLFTAALHAFRAASYQHSQVQICF